MPEIEVEKNIPSGEPFEALDSLLRAQYPGIYNGMVSSRGHVRAQVSDKASDVEIAAIRIYIVNFDIATKTPEQQSKATNLAAIKTAAQSAVGLQLTDLTAGQVKALLAALLWRAGAVNPDGTVRPLGEWLK